jgi:hypothetical protein
MQTTSKHQNIKLKIIRSETDADRFDSRPFVITKRNGVLIELSST